MIERRGRRCRGPASGLVARSLLAPLEEVGYLCNPTRSLTSFDMRQEARGEAFCLLFEYRSKTVRNRLEFERVVGWLHPRRARLGLIEASVYEISTDGASCGIRGARASASLKR